MTSEAGEARSHTRDKALRRTRALVAGAAAGAVGLSGVLSAVAAQAFKGHPHRSASPPAAVAKTAQRSSPSRVHVPGPQSVPSIAGQPAPLQPPAQPPAAAQPAPSAPSAPSQVSGGS